MKLLRGHGLGNDYLILTDGPVMTPALAVQICDRHTGVGSDGILEPFSTDEADHGVRIWNPDGSIAEKSGNGLRIFARWLFDHCDAGASFSLWTGACRVDCECNAQTIEIDMGVVSALEAHVHDLDVVLVDVGNPHCVVFVDDFELDWRTLGAQLEVHPHFPNKTNVQFVRCIDGALHARIWERGAGETQASGSSSCAVVVAAVHTGRVSEGDHAVIMPGGTLDIRVAAGRAHLRGPAVLVGEFRVFEGYFS